MFPNILGALTLPDLGVTASDFATAISSPLGGWVGGGLGIGAALVAVLIGWRCFRKVAK
jgi:hypothetical protein